MNNQLVPVVVARSRRKFSMLALAAQKCELKSDSIMLGVLALTEENPKGLTVDHLNKILFDNSRYQIAKTILDNGIVTGELKKEDEKYFLTDFGKDDLLSKKVWVNEQTKSWELLCFPEDFCINVESIMRSLDARVKIEAGWRPIEDLKTDENIKNAYSVWLKISQKEQLKVVLDGKQKGVLLVNEFAEPPTSSETNTILARTCIFDVTIELAPERNWIIKSLEYASDSDAKYSVPFEITESPIQINGPTDHEWEHLLRQNGLEVTAEGNIFCYYTPNLDADFSMLKVSEIVVDYHSWEICFSSVPLKARDTKEALSWFSEKLAQSCGKMVAAHDDIKLEAIKFLRLSGLRIDNIIDADLQEVILKTIKNVDRRGDASRLGFIYDFET